MGRRLLTRGWVLVGCACFAVVTGAASCSTTGATGTSVSGKSLSIYVSIPPGTISPEAQDVLDAEQLAFNQLGRRVRRFRVRLKRFQGRELSDTARQAIGDSTTIAYVGEIAPGASADTLGITNAEDVLQVSPTDTAVELTRSTSAISNAPDRYYESLSTNGRTFARVVPTSAVEAGAVASEMESLGVKSVYVPTDGSSYGKALRAAFVSRAGSALTVVGSDSSADAVFYAGRSASGAASAFDGAAAANPKVALFAPSALAENSFAASLSPGAQRNLYVSSPGFTSAPDSSFTSSFRAAYGHAPAPQAVFGYVAVQGVLRALERAGTSASNRKTVVGDFFSLRNFRTAAGPMWIDKNGDVSFAGGDPFVFSRIKAGKLVPVKAISEQG